MFSYYGKDTRTDQERYLEDELERERESQRERERIEDKRREANRRGREEMWNYEARQADSWPEAFQKQAMLCRREQNHFPEPDDDPFFLKNAEANEKALEIWHAVATSKRAQLDELQKQIDAVWDDVRNEVADQLEKADDHFVYKSTAEAIRDDELTGYLDW